MRAEDPDAEDDRVGGPEHVHAAGRGGVLRGPQQQPPHEQPGGHDHHLADPHRLAQVVAAEQRGPGLHEGRERPVDARRPRPRRLDRAGHRVRAAVPGHRRHDVRVAALGRDPPVRRVVGVVRGPERRGQQRQRRQRQRPDPARGAQAPAAASRPPRSPARPARTARPPSRYAVQRAAVTVAEDRCSGRSPGAHPRGPRPGRAADGAATPTSSSRAKEAASATGRTRSQPVDGRGGAGSAVATARRGAAGHRRRLRRGTPQPAGREGEPHVAVLPGRGAAGRASPDPRPGGAARRAPRRCAGRPAARRRSARPRRPSRGPAGWPASNAARLRQRMPDSGCVARQPVSLAMPSRASRTTKPWPPPAVRCGGRMAIAHVGRPGGDRRHQHAEVGGAGLEVGVDEEQVPRPGRPPAARGRAGHAIRAPVVIAAALPRLRAWRATTAPAARASSAVASLLPSSTTTTRSTPGQAGRRGDGRARCGPPRPWRGSRRRRTRRGRPCRSAQGDLAAQQARRGPAAPPAVSGASTASASANRAASSATASS